MIVLLGGAGGIGRQLHAELLLQGATVVVMDLARSLKAHPVEGPAIPVDITDTASVKLAFDQIDGPIQGFVNLAGYNAKLTPLTEMEPDYFDDILAGNLRGAWLVAKAALPRMVRDGTGSYVNVSSGLAHHVRPGYGAYSAAKAAVIAMTKTLALEEAPAIRVNAVAPAAVDTAFLRGGTGKSDESAVSVLDVEAYRRATPLDRVARPDDITGPIRFLLGRDSRFMTGQILWVNGGGYLP